MPKLTLLSHSWCSNNNMCCRSQNHLSKKIMTIWPHNILSASLYNSINKEKSSRHWERTIVRQSECLYTYARCIYELGILIQIFYGVCRMSIADLNGFCFVVITIMIFLGKRMELRLCEFSFFIFILVGIFHWNNFWSKSECIEYVLLRQNVTIVVFD